jgi:hypothetical protein
MNKTNAKTTKKIKVATYADGTRFIIKKVSGCGYEWNHGCYSSHMDNAIWNVELHGGTVTTEENPNYCEPAAPTALDLFEAMFS